MDLANLFILHSEKQTLDIVFDTQVRWKSDVSATDPKDYIYSRLALLRETDRAQVTVDYGQLWTCRELYCQLTAMLLEQEGSIILQDIHSLGNSRLDLPSWTIDFSCTTDRKSGLSLGRLTSFNCAGSVSNNSLPLTVNAGVLHALGIQVDIVKSIADVFPHPPFQVDGDPDLDPMYYAWEHLAHLRAWIERLRTVLEINVHENNERKEEALWRMIVVDYRGQNLLPEIHEGYQILMGKMQPPANFEGDVQTWQIEGSAPFIKACEVRGRTPFITSSGRLGNAQHPVMVGDHVCILQGSRVPFIFQKQQSGQYRLKSEAYVHGIMYGEMIQDEYDPEQWDCIEIC